ncbi:hypothetical protein [Cellulosilyticum ruminicola]|uniref:hypothetical protein n=1 Tax=Cellulosilyticum ruminicola TaxID=425254 RepID=UPI0006D17A11|nr:hypothetical protein [Cellulosilyticum ruminicola]
MKNLKALIKIERKPALVMGIYFLIVNLIAVIGPVGSMNNIWRWYLEAGISRYDFWEIGSRIYESSYCVLIGYMLGIVLLVYLQFKKDKSIEIGRFIKALPYTNGQRATVKITMGILSITIPFLIYGLLVLAMRSYYTNLFSEVLRVTAFETVSTYLNRISVYLGILGVAYIRLIMIYLILILGEYLLSHNVGSLIITAVSVMAPAYLWLSNIEEIGSRVDLYQYDEEGIAHGIGYYLHEINSWLEDIYMNYMNTRGGGIKISAGESFNYTTTERGSIVGLIYFVVAVICCLVIVKQVKKQRIENIDILIPSQFIRGIFIAGYALCSGCLVRDLSKEVLNQVALGYPRIILDVLLVIGLIVGVIIARKVASIGLQNKREV